jgi:hypothetical protein
MQSTYMLLLASEERHDCRSPSPRVLSSAFSSDGSDLFIPSFRFVWAELPVIVARTT